MKYFKKLVGENIYLSPMNPADAEQFAKWLNDFQTTDYIGRSFEMKCVEEEREYLEKVAREGTYFSIVTKEDKLIGTCSLEEINSIRRVATLGIFIGEPEERNKGYGTEAIQLLLDYGFHYLNIHNIELEAMAWNERAIACYRKCGFKEFGRRRESEFLNGKYYDRVYMDILENEFTGSYIQNKNI